MVQIHLNKTYISRISFSQPSSEEIHSNPLYITILRNILALQRYNDKSGYFKVLDSLFDSEIWVQIGKYQGSYGLGGEKLSVPQSKSYLTLKATNDILIVNSMG